MPTNSLTNQLSYNTHHALQNHFIAVLQYHPSTTQTTKMPRPPAGQPNRSGHPHMCIYLTTSTTRSKSSAPAPAIKTEGKNPSPSAAPTASNAGSSNNTSQETIPNAAPPETFAATLEAAMVATARRIARKEIATFAVVGKWCASTATRIRPSHRVTGGHNVNYLVLLPAAERTFQPNPPGSPAWYREKHRATGLQ